MLRSLFITGTVVAGIFTLASCSDGTRQPPKGQIPVMTFPVSTNTYYRWEKIGVNGTPKEVNVDYSTVGISNTRFEEAEEDEKEPLSKEFNQHIAVIRAASRMSPAQADEKVRAVAKARDGFETIAGKTTNERLKLLAHINVVACDIALGDIASFPTHQARLPKVRERSGAGNFYADSAALMFGSKTVQQDVIMAWHDDHLCEPPTSGLNRGDEIIKTVSKTVKNEILPTFAFAADTAAVQSFPSLRVEIVSQFGTDQKMSYEDRYNALSLLLKATNTSPRVMSVSGMAIKLTHNGRDRSYRTVDAQYRLLPGETTTVNFATDSSKWSDMLREKSAGLSSCVIYDVPVQVDDLGNVTRKENLTWKFTFDPGAPAEIDIDTEKSTYKFNTYLRGIDRLAKLPTQPPTPQN